MDKKLTVSVLIATKDRFDDVNLCISYVIKQVYLPKQIIVVDASDMKGLENICRIAVGDVDVELVYIKSEVKSSAIQRNMGIERNTSDVILIMDDDVIIHSSYIKELIPLLNEDLNEEIAAVTGNIANTVRFSPFSRLLRTIFMLQNEGKGEVRKSWANNNYYKIKSLQQVVWVSTCCTMFRAKMLENERFDDLFQGYSYMEDFDLSYRLSKHHKLFYNPDVRCVHNHKELQKETAVKRNKQKMFMINLRYLFVKNMPQRFDYKVCHYWSYIGYILRGLLLERDRGYILGTWDGIKLNITGRNPLVKLRKKGH